MLKTNCFPLLLYTTVENVLNKHEIFASGLDVKQQTIKSAMVDI